MPISVNFSKIIAEEPEKINQIGSAITLLMWNEKDKPVFYPRIIPSDFPTFLNECSNACEKYSLKNDGKIPGICKKTNYTYTGEKAECNIDPLIYQHLKPKKQTEMLRSQFGSLMLNSQAEAIAGSRDEHDVFRFLDPKKPYQNPFDIPVSSENIDDIKITNSQRKLLYKKRLLTFVTDPQYFIDIYGKDIVDNKKFNYNLINCKVPKK